MVDSLCSSLPVWSSHKREYLEYSGLLPLEITDGTLRVAVAGEPDEEALLDLQDSYGSANLELVTVPLEELLGAIGRAYASSESVVEFVRSLGEDEEPQTVRGEAAQTVLDVRDLANQVPVVRYVNLLLREAHGVEASDIHLEATEASLRVRFRIDGVLTEAPGPPTEMQAAVVSRLKLLAEMDIAERRKAQDGRIRIRLESRDLDIRISTLPTIHGESMVLRLLDQGGRPVTLEELGFPPEQLPRFRRLAKSVHGILLATGPTGSGKTTTLYAILANRDPTREKIITVEDPVEYSLPGVTQVPVRSKGGISFASSLRSILRQDPDVILVGEMRDQETAGIAVQAAMTGHLVLSTLHTNDSVSALTRLLDLGIPPYLVAATVDGVLAQRLVRRVCTACRESYMPDRGTLELMTEGAAPVFHTYQRGTGCSACHFTGFRGRTGLFEFLELTDELRHELASPTGPSRLRPIALSQGLRTLRQHGWTKAVAGITTVEEVIRVVGE